MNTDRLPPHSHENEQGVLGCILIAPNESIGQCLEAFASPEVFYDLRHQLIYETILAMHERREPVEVVTVFQRLKDLGKLEQAGGIEYLSALPDVVPSAANIGYYISIVECKHALRKMIAVCTDSIAMAYNHTGNDIGNVLDSFEEVAMRVRRNGVTKTRNMKVIVNSVIERIESAFERKGKIEGISYGFHDMNRITGGIKRQEMIIIAARPSTGKTALGMNIAEAVAVDQKIPVGVFSLEMSDEALGWRMVCSRSRVGLSSVQFGNLAERDFGTLLSAAMEMANAPLHIDDTGGLSVQQLRARARRMVQQHGVKLFIVDYLTMLHSSKKSSNRQDEVREISNQLKSMAKELDVPVIVLCQLNRQIEQDKNRKPRLSDLRESGAIEQDADLIMMLYRPATEDDEEDTAIHPVNALVAKQRNGPSGSDIKLIFNKTITRFEQASKFN